MAYARGTRCYVVGCPTLCSMGKLCGKHWRQLPLQMRPAAWRGDMAEALRFFDTASRARAGRGADTATSPSSKKGAKGKT